MVDKIRDRIDLLKNKKIRFRYNGSRNQIEEFFGVITECYNYVFIIKSNGINRSFSYSDVLIGVLDVNI